MNRHRIIENPNLTDPAKRHRPRKGSRAYHNRIQKKWIKRYGVVPSEKMYRGGGAIVCHPVVAARLRREMSPPRMSAGDFGVQLWAGML